jgi:hypothetical protein
MYLWYTSTDFKVDRIITTKATNNVLVLRVELDDKITSEIKENLLRCNALHQIKQYQGEGVADACEDTLA